MANLTPERQAAKVAEARRLARQGYTRREIDPIIREKYGEGIHPRIYTRLYAERKADTIKRLEKQPALKRKPSPEPEPQKAETKRRSTLLVPHYSRPTRTLQGRFYRRLRAAGFSGDEAIPMEVYWRKYRSPVTGRKETPPFIVEMLAARRAMKEAHEIEARAKGWGASRSNSEFAKKIKAVYEELEKRGYKAFITLVRVKAKGNRPGYWRTIPRTINIWALMEATLDDLPVELRWGSP